MDSEWYTATQPLGWEKAQDETKVVVIFFFFFILLLALASFVIKIPFRLYADTRYFIRELIERMERE